MDDSVIIWDLRGSLERHSAINALNKAIEEAERILFKYIEVYYNHRMKQLTNGWKMPAHCKRAWYNHKKVA